MNETDKPTFVYVTYIAATPQQVWDALTSGEFTRQYWGGMRIQSDWVPGSAVTHVTEAGGIGWEGEVLRSEPPHALSYTFHMLMSAEKRAERPSRVTFELETVGSVVKLTLTHDEFDPDSATHWDTSHGWPAIMSSLKSLLETGSPLPFSRLGFAPARSASGTT